MGSVELEFPARVLGLLLCLAGLVFMGLGLGGIYGSRCKDALPLPISPEAQLNRFEGADASGKAETPGGPMPNCVDKVELSLVGGFFPLDVLFYRAPPVDAAGAVAFHRHQVNVRARDPPNGVPYTAFEPRSVGLDNVVFASSGGIKLGFLLALCATGVTVALVLSSKDLICYSQPNIIRVEKCLLMAGAVGNVAGGSLGVAWGLFSQLSAADMRQSGLESLVCPGWVIGGALHILAGLFQAVDFSFSLIFHAPLKINTKGGGKKKKKTQEAPKYFTATHNYTSGPVTLPNQQAVPVAPIPGDKDTTAADSVVKMEEKKSGAQSVVPDTGAAFVSVAATPMRGMVAHVPEPRDGGTQDQTGTTDGHTQC